MGQRERRAWELAHQGLAVAYGAAQRDAGGTTSLTNAHCWESEPWLAEAQRTSCWKNHRAPFSLKCFGVGPASMSSSRPPATYSCEQRALRWQAAGRAVVEPVV